MHKRFALISLVILTGFIFSCSGSSNPSQPSVTQDNGNTGFKFTQTGPNSLILAAWDIYIDVENMEVEAVPLRSSQLHVNVTPLITPPNCYGCFLAKNLEWDSVNQIVTIDIGFRNPSNLTGFDVRGIVTYFGNKEFLNPDGYTELFSPTIGEINPFVAYKTGIGNRTFPGLTDQYETMEIYNPNFPSFQPFTYVVEASWPDNCKEPYEIVSGGITGPLYNDGSNEQVLTIYARDWQDDIASVTVDLTPFGGSLEQLTPSPTFPDAYQISLASPSGLTPGEYELLITARTNAPFDQTDSMYNYVTVKVQTPPNPEAEIFGLPERITNSPGDSYIWPRHAIAVTSDGTSHCVWVDTTDNPNVWHVFYSYKDGDNWTTPKQIDAVNGEAVYATVSVDSSDTIHIVWEDSRNHVVGSDIYYASSTDNFASETIIVTGDNGFRNIHPKIYTASDDSLHMTWHSKELVDVDEYEYEIWYDTRPAAASSWSGAISVTATEDINEVWPAVETALNGDVYLAYSSDEVGTNGIYFCADSTGVFGEPVLVSGNDAFQPTLAVGPDGTIYVSYFDYLDGSFCDIYMRTSSDGGSVWSSPTKVSDNDLLYQYAPDIEVTADGDIHVVWHEEDDNGRPARVLYRENVNSLGWQDIIEFVDSSGMGCWPSMDSDTENHIHCVYQQWTPGTEPGGENYEIWYRDSTE